MIHSCDTEIFVHIEAGPSVDQEIVDRLKSIPLPEGFLVSGDPSSREGFTLAVTTVDWENPLPTGAHPDAFVEPPVKTKLLERVWYVPAVPFLCEAIDLNELDESDVFELKSLEDIALPSRGLSVNGLYPGDEGYPYHRDTVVYLRTGPAGAAGTAGASDRDRKEVFQLLAAWFESVPGPAAPPAILWFGGVGDVMPGRGVSELLASPGGLEAVFSDTLPYLQRPDVLAGNLEGAVTLRGSPAAKSYTFRFRPEILALLKKAGFDYLSITNNHSYDFGEVGFLDTLRHLQDAGLGTSGAGADLARSVVPSSFTADGREIRILSMGAYPPERNGFDGEKTAAAGATKPGILWADESGIAAAASTFSDQAFDVVMVHGGVEWTTEPSPEQRELYRRLIDLGADAVIGSHPHYLQGIEAYRGGLIAYSLGNFIFPGMEETDYGEESMVLLLGIVDGMIRYIEMVPVKIDGKTLSLDRTGAILTRVLERSAALN
ncbi:MAG: CapA family protein [Spirochaetales bacterium]|nr:CapA family protein [Spirochaetales bacterium]